MGRVGQETGIGFADIEGHRWEVGAIDEELCRWLGIRLSDRQEWPLRCDLEFK
jgi:hypothetical protein